MSGARIAEWSRRAKPRPASPTGSARIALRERAQLWWWIAFIPSCGLFMVGVIGVVWLFYAGVGIWGIDWPVAWGFAIINYVWWIAIASGGTFISALFFLLRVEWRTAINRIAETMMIFAAGAAGIFPILHLGRPWLFYWLFPYPNSMALWPQWRSPLLWDFFAILTYVLASRDLLVFRPDPRSRLRARPGAHALAADLLRRTRARLPRLEQGMAALPRDLRHHGGDHGAAWSSRSTASSASISPAA